MKKLLTGLALSGLVLLAQAGPKEDIAAAMKAGQWQDAQARLEQVLAKHPENAQAHYWMAETLYRQGQLAEAKAQLDEALRLDPSHQFTNNAKALAALQNRLKSVGSTAAPQGQAGQGPAVPATQARTEPAAREAAAPAEKKSGPSWFTWLLIGGVVIGLAMWFTRRTVKDAKEDERKALTAQLEASLNDIRDASRAIDSRADLPVEARFAMSDRARTCEQQLVAELARIKTREEFSTTRELVAQARDVAADLRGQERPSERAARLREAQLQAEAQRGMGYGQPGYGQGYGPGYGQPGYAPQGPGMGGVIAGAALGAVAGMAVGSAMASDSHSSSHSGGSSSGGGQGFQPFDAEPPLDLSGGSSSNWDTGSSGSSWDSGSSSSDSWSTGSSSSDIDFGGGGGDDWS